MNRAELRKNYKGKHREKLLEAIFRLENENDLLKLEGQRREHILEEQKKRLDSTEYEIIRSFEKEHECVFGFFTSCMTCQRLRNKKGEWEDIGQILKPFTSRSISTGLCPYCQEMLNERKEMKRQIEALKKNVPVNPSADK